MGLSLSQILSTYKPIYDLLHYFHLQVDRLTRSTIRSLLFQSLSSSDVVRDLVDREVRSEKDFEWRAKPRCFLSQDNNVELEVLHVRRAYCYEHLGDCPHPVYTPSLRYQLLALLTAFQLKHFPLVRSPASPAPASGCGKLALVREVARSLGILLVLRSAVRHFDSNVVLQAGLVLCTWYLL